MKFSEKIKEQLIEKNIDVEQVRIQINQFNHGIDPVKLERVCKISDGITKLSESQINHYQNYFQNTSSTVKIVKFVPASGAATRMFKHLFDYQNNKSNPLVIEFFEKIKVFPFYTLLQQASSQLNQYLENKNYQPIIDAILVEMKYGSLPKGSILFHRYQDEIRTAFEEHLYEGKNYCQGKNKQINIHFTISKKHENSILKLLHKKIRASFSKENIFVDFSYQKPNTDTITVDIKNNLIEDSTGHLVFRPGGHGALIHNLNEIDSDIIFIKNIDNVVPDSKRQDTILYKRVLGGMALEMKALRNRILNHLEEKKSPNNEDIQQFIKYFELENKAYSSQELYHLIHRPIRICGMVKNQNEPGGGPFWVKDFQGQISKQIVEKSQINLDDKNQKTIFSQSTHFNPVDLVCITKNHKDEKFNLLDFVDEKSGFITEKSLQGKSIKALELPGLWNGAMAKWNTLFVEVPLSTFNPVKTVNDLIRPIRIS